MSDTLLDGLVHGFLDENQDANIDYIPSLVTNDPDEGKKVLCDVIKELNKCIEFKFCVAFLNMGGVQALLTTLKNLEEKGIKGTVIVSGYQNFTEPKALRAILNFKNINLKIIPEETKLNMHTKGYIFKYSEDEYSIIVGSSNLTQNALCKNKEWNVKLNSRNNGSYTRLVLNKFDEMERYSISVTEEWIKEYEEVYKEFKPLLQANDEIVNYGEIKPNSMQIEALDELNKIRERGQDKALVISSTGTGKTILCALDVKQVNPDRVLFVIHRENICNAALKTFKRVLGKNIKTALYGGGSTKEIGDAQYVFAMMQTLSKESNLKSFAKDEFDYIIFDEAHHLGSASELRIFNYFKPKFVLGMTATPERMDKFDLFGLFEHNLACEIRLNDAMKADLICPFHYYGVSDITVDGKEIEDDEDFSNLTSDERVKHILDKISFYGYSGNKVKGLIFTSRIEEAEYLSAVFNDKGYRTVAISSKNSNVEMDDAIRKLESDDENECLDYIFAVDKFNEGIDIQKINQVVMLRPTQSAIVFVQQLGRGLRKNAEKEYVVVIDFIGNYNNNYLVPIALSGDRSYNKDNLRKFIKEGNKTIYGASTIEFEPIVEKRIFEKIDSTKFGTVKMIRDAYFDLKNKLGRIPNLDDFDKFESIDPVKIFECKTYRSYYTFLKKVEINNYNIVLNEEEVKYLEFVSIKYGRAKKIVEAEAIKLLINNPKMSFDKLVVELNDVLFKDCRIGSLDKYAIANLKNQLTGNYYNVKDNNSIFIKNDFVDKKFFDFIDLDSNFKELMLETLDFIIRRHKEKNLSYYNGSLLSLNEKYTYEEVVRTLNWAKDLNGGAIGGYKYDQLTNTLPIFVNYDKASDIKDSINYADEFISRDTMKWISKNGRSLVSKEIAYLLNAKKNNTNIYLFVRKNKTDEESKEFYFFGKVNVLPGAKDIKMDEKNKAVEMQLKLEEPVIEYLYDYITND